MKEPYVGITGFMSQDEVWKILDLFPPDSSRLLMVGILVSDKTLRGQQNKWPGRYPKNEKVMEICVNHSRAFNLVHYYTHQLDELLSQLIDLTNLGGPHLNGFQLNITWPLPQVLREYLARYPDMKIVLQIGEKAFGMVGHSPQNLAQKVAEEYSGIVDYTLLDLSGGYGKPLDTMQARQCLEALKAKNLNIGLGVAGGLSPSSLNLVKPLVKDFPDLSIDAEGRLRNKDDDSLNLEFAKSYACKALNLFGN